MRAKCRGMADALFPEAADQKRARSVCAGCPVRLECLAEALDNRIEWGVWGGMTERERRLAAAAADRRPLVALSAGRPAARQRDEVTSRSVTSVGSDGTTARRT